jgi:hypothetical protein
MRCEPFELFSRFALVSKCEPLRTSDVKKQRFARNLGMMRFLGVCELVRTSVKLGEVYKKEYMRTSLPPPIYIGGERFAIWVRN